MFTSFSSKQFLNFAELVYFVYWWSCIGKQACLYVIFPSSFKCKCDNTFKPIKQLACPVVCGLKTFWRYLEFLIMKELGTLFYDRDHVS